MKPMKVFLVYLFSVEDPEATLSGIFECKGDAVREAENAKSKSNLDYYILPSEMWLR